MMILLVMAGVRKEGRRSGGDDGEMTAV